MVPTNTSGHSMHSQIIWCADHALRPGWPVASTGPLHASWPGTQKGGVEQIRINKSKKRFLLIALRRANTGSWDMGLLIGLLHQPRSYVGGVWYSASPELTTAPWRVTTGPW